MLTRTSLGFSPVMFLFYTGVVALVLHGVPTTSTDLMEEGSLQTTPSSILPPSLLRPLPRLVPRDSPVRAPHCSTPRRTTRAAPRAFTACVPADDHPHFADAISVRAGLLPDRDVDGVAIPLAHVIADVGECVGVDGATMVVCSATLVARLRNGSVMDLTALQTRQSLMRSASRGLQGPLNGYHHA